MDHDDLLTREERERVEQFLSAFSDIEAMLKVRLGLSRTNRTNVTTLIRDYAERNPYWNRDSSDLGHLKDIRNLLVHERSQEYGYPFSVTKRSLNRLMAIGHILASPIPISNNHRKGVVLLNSTDSLAYTLKIAYEREFSQFPVFVDGQFRGLITENEITRWLGSQVTRKTSLVNLENVSVRQVLREKEPDRRQIFRFCALDVPEVEVMGFFQRNPALEVVLLTENGKKDTAIQGIVTQWDAARYPPIVGTAKRQPRNDDGSDLASPLRG